MTNQNKCAYLAGLIDGEGCIRIDRGRLWNRARTGWHWRYKLVVRIAMCAQPTLLWVQQQFGGKVYARSTNSMKCLGARARQQWVWVCAERQAEEIIHAILPFLQNKKTEAKLALQFRKLVPAPGTKSSLEIREQQLLIAEQLSALKTLEYKAA